MKLNLYKVLNTLLGKYASVGILNHLHIERPEAWQY